MVGLALQAANNVAIGARPGTRELFQLTGGLVGDHFASYTAPSFWVTLDNGYTIKVIYVTHS